MIYAETNLPIDKLDGNGTTMNQSMLADIKIMFATEDLRIAERKVPPQNSLDYMELENL